LKTWDYPKIPFKLGCSGNPPRGPAIKDALQALLDGAIVLLFGSAPAFERKYFRKWGLKIGFILGIEAKSLLFSKTALSVRSPDFGFFSDGDAVSMRPVIFVENTVASKQALPVNAGAEVFVIFAAY
jgi:hypothetical protein